uniref:Uncharacterized protein n=1 Tax=Tanacetum cinerariifolium TaxID=118510 RepID=A0A6L2M134_TANCI|nr:hypothetical protein [Tanacetum cinerariifolium]
MYNKKNVDYVALLWEDFMYQADYKEISSARKEHMAYPRFTKFIINHFISKDKTISMRNMIYLHTIRDDSLLGVVIRDALGVSVSNNKALAKADRSKGVPDEKQRKTSGIDEGTGTIPGVPDVPKYQSNSNDESWGDNEDDNDDDSEDNNYDNNDDVSKGDDDKADSDNDDSDAHDSEMTDSSDDDENPYFTLKDYDEEEHDEEYESDDDNENVFKKEDGDLYKDVDVRSLGADHKKERKDDAEMTEADQNISPPSDHEVTSLMNIKMSHEVPSPQISFPLTEPATVIPDSSTIASTIVPLTISMISPLPQLLTPSPAPTTVLITTSIPTLLDFSFLFSFDQRVSTLEIELSQLKQADQTALESYTKEFEKKAQEERNLYIDVVEKLVKDIIKDEVKSLLPQILPKKVLDFATPVIQSTIIESLENVILAKSSSQPKSTYEALESLTEFELKKILLDKIKRSESYKTDLEHKELYKGLVKPYNLNKDLSSSYGNLYSLMRDHDDKDKDEDPFAGSDRWLKK